MRNTALILCLALLLGACGGGNNSAPPAADDDGNAEQQCAAPSGPSAEDRRRARDLFEKARNASTAHDNTGAEELLRRAVEIDPEYGLAHAWLGRVLHELGRYDEAYTHHMRAAELADEPELRREQRREAALDSYAMAENATQAGKFADAERHIRRAMELGRESHSGLVRLGDALRHQDRLEEAEAAYRRAAGMTSGQNRHWALYWAGRAQCDQEDYEGAEATFTELIRKDYTGQDVYAWRGYCRYMLEDYENALDDYSRAQRHATSKENAKRYAELEGTLLRELQADD